MRLMARRLKMGFLVGLTIGSASARSDTNAPPPRSYIKPINFSRLADGFEKLPARDRNLIKLYLKAARRYVLTEPDGVFPNGGTEHWRNIAERAHGAAVMTAVPSDWPKELKS